MGDLTLQGLLNLAEAGEGNPFLIAITGGTERYRTAHGEMRVQFLSESEQDRTFRILR